MIIVLKSVITILIWISAIQLSKKHYKNLNIEYVFAIVMSLVIWA